MNRRRLKQRIADLEREASAAAQMSSHLGKMHGEIVNAFITMESELSMANRQNMKLRELNERCIAEISRLSNLGLAAEALIDSLQKLLDEYRGGRGGNT